jgi:hypothetical protein
MIKRSLALITLVLILALTGCGGQAPTAAPTAVSEENTPVAPAIADTAPANSAKPAIDACTVLSKAEVEASLGGAIKEPEPKNQSSTMSICQFMTQEGVNLVLLEIHTSGGTDLFEGYQSSLTESTPVTGLGDKAFMSAKGTQLYALKGDILVGVTLQLEDAAAQPKAAQDLVRKVLEHL